MSDENVEQEHKSVPIHELSETPFGGNFGGSEHKAEVTEPGPEQQQEVPSEEPQPEAQAEAPAEAAETAEVAGAAEPAEAEEPMTMEAALAESNVDYSGTFKGLTVGDVVDGVVVHIDREGVLVDVGTKSEGIIRPGELSRDQSLDPEQVVSVGEKIRVYVVDPEGHEGGPVLSKKRADFENAWERVEKAYADGGVLKAMVSDRVKGGLVVDLGIRGFVPASHVGSGKLKNLDKFVGQSITIKVIEVDRDRRKVVLSNRLAMEEEQQSVRKETIANLKEGQIRDGIVRRITDYGAFVDLGGVDGLLHISEMSWTRISHPSECVRVGAKIQVMVLKLNLEQGRVSLGLRQILPDPWEDVKRIHRVGDVVQGQVTRLVPFGAFVQVEGGVEGIIPNSELAQRRVNSPEDVVSSGQQVEVKIIDLRPDERRLTLSLKQLQVQQERAREEAEYKSYSQERPEGRTTIGDLIGEQLNGVSFAAPEPEKPARKRARAKAAKRASLEEAEALAEAEEMMVEEAVEVEAKEEPAAVEAEAEVSEPEAEPAAEAVPEKKGRGKAKAAGAEPAAEKKPAAKRTRKKKE